MTDESEYLSDDDPRGPDADQPAPEPPPEPDEQPTE